jgi:hypothetical protein
MALPARVPMAWMPAVKPAAALVRRKVLAHSIFLMNSRVERVLAREVENVVKTVMRLTRLLDSG